ncbi:hypothetical protein PSHT_00748 [Puccinia striiformis]|uniref:Uncharacterized protein n=1 Tax=Puccinia striiformis TaxID=27350 RepID=A0A2S4WMQ3_9BASI|nr:hypothetical protein PSHT_00748 [Puccinia striiformis]
MVQCFRLHRILMFFLFSAKVRKSAQCKLGSQGVLGGVKDSSVAQNERSKSISSLNSYLTETNQESQNLKEYASPLSQAGSKDVSSGEVVPTTSQSPEDRSHKKFSKEFALNSAINSSGPPSNLPETSAPLPPTLPRSQLDYEKQQGSIVTRDMLIAISILALSLLFIAIMWLALIVFYPMVRSSRMRLGSRSWFKKKKKLDCPPQWWTQFQVNSQRSHAEASSINEFFDEGANPMPTKMLDMTARPHFGSTKDLATEHKPTQPRWDVPAEFYESQEVLDDPESQWELSEKSIPPSRLENWLRGTNGMRGTVFLATAAIRKDPNLFLTKGSAILPGLPSLGPSDSASRY